MQWVIDRCPGNQGTGSNLSGCLILVVIVIQNLHVLLVEVMDEWTLCLSETFYNKFIIRFTNIKEQGDPHPGTSCSPVFPFIGLCVRAVGNMNVNRFICSESSKISKCDKKDTYQWMRWRCGVSPVGVWWSWQLSSQPSWQHSSQPPRLRVDAVGQRWSQWLEEHA